MAMSNLLNNSQVLEKAKKELDFEIGQESLKDESDVSKLPYLQSIISETLRLHPAGPILLPHMSHSGCTIQGYDVPSSTTLFVNAWAIHRDPQLWDDAGKFKPERFEGAQGEAYNSKFLPFGLGRGACPGMGLANRVLGFTLGRMIQRFEWMKVDDQATDMTEGLGDIVFAGTESSALTLEWAMSNLLNNPQVLEKAKKELDFEIGQESLMDESDVSKLPYLQSIILETLRLHPAGPLLLPHLSRSDCTIQGYDVPSNTIVFVNAWAIHRDPQLWDDAGKFKPERFEGAQGEPYNSKFLPFGLGRRACPGMGLANRVIGFTLGCMIQCFEWMRVNAQEVDMTEGIGLTMPKAKPLEAMCKARDIMKIS
ncbi:hypothetical protein GH714_032886 [Hevea brasiliensis]|uniref:Cytochrome P450 n=1 Tax=Hevea brasiliensis TaxID=3981 RepID=A0A6A6LL26_HEVBR|nr:hypothetical protein GH714_032886 [Hevea brasiliensis]